MAEVFYPARTSGIVLTPNSISHAGVDCVANVQALAQLDPTYRIMVGGILAKSIHPQDGPPAIWNTPWPWHAWLIDANGNVVDPSFHNLTL